ncbi:MAG: hypothetical protein GY841_22755 [FCB group bacterium]|nr:hypothetical protein [FCB group bacterium]
MKSKLPVEVIEEYKNWEPPVRLKRVVERILKVLPPDKLVGIGTVVLTNASGLNRVRRREKSRSRKRSLSLEAIGGFYHHAHKGKPAWIELFIDNTFVNQPPCAWRLPFWRNWVIGCMLCHEIGHHIHFTMKPEFRECEDVADDWGLKLVRYQYGQLHYLASTNTSIIHPFMKLMRKLDARKRQKQMGQTPLE